MCFVIRFARKREPSRGTNTTGASIIHSIFLILFSVLSGYEFRVRVGSQEPCNFTMASGSLPSLHARPVPDSLRALRGN